MNLNLEFLKDGDQWCCQILGIDPGVAIQGYGDTKQEALQEFAQEWEDEMDNA